MEAKTSVQVIPADRIRELVPQTLFSEIYNLPEFMLAVAPSESWYARIDDPEFGTAYFPFTGQKWLWKWRLFQASFCQRFSPISTQGLVHSQHWKSWKNWLENHCWFGSWSFFPYDALEGGKKSRNQFFNLDYTAAQLVQNWKPNRRQALQKSAECSVKALGFTDFFGELKLILNTNLKSKWSPSFKEIQILRRISKLEIPDFECFHFGVFFKEKCVALIQLVRYRNRLYYLFSLSSPLGLGMESMTHFFWHAIHMFAERPLIFDFEGSNIPGVYSFFRSLGGIEEHYGTISI